ncbi:MAG: glycosyltransferase family 4 protein [Desulfobacteraceae bacterium]|nr:glycosyltransferase family 4 protein [Desulfobacteraceae bacterium]
MRTIANMVDHLGDEFDFWIVTRDRDALDIEPYPNVEIDSWNTVGKARVFYGSPRTTRLPGVSGLLRKTPHDVLYLNSFFSFEFTALPLLSRRLGLAPKKPCIIAPRGQFSTGALDLKAWKKRPYLGLTWALGLYQNLIWQASSEYEAADIQQTLGKTAKNISIAPNLPPLMSSLEQKVEHSVAGSRNPLKVVFLSRITHKKNLDFALQVLANVKIPVDFNIYGSIFDENYWQQCQRMIQDLPENIKVSYHGLLPHERVEEVLVQHALFFFPTRGENFGHVIYEALAAGLPVLISDQTPWRGLQEKGVGWDIPLSAPEQFAGIIETVFHMSDEELVKIKRKAIYYASNFIHESGVLDKNREMFYRAVKQNPMT